MVDGSNQVRCSDEMCLCSFQILWYKRERKLTVGGMVEGSRQASTAPPYLSQGHPGKPCTTIMTMWLTGVACG